MTKQVILTGLRANNDLQLGNYLGGLLPIVQLQQKYAKDYQINLFVPDLHSFTTPIDHTQLYAQIINNLRVYVAAGLELDNSNTYLYRQSFIPAHSELTVILNSFTYFGELKRMTQFKEKSGGHDNVSVGLFDYPVLMAADILLYGAKYIPLGEDQNQHVELARDIGIRLNNKFEHDFPNGLLTIPLSIEQQNRFMQQQNRLRIRDLVHPEKKMSKSDATGKGVIFLSDDPKVAAKKIMSATTDSIGKIIFDMKNQPGISNLLVILAALTEKPLQEVVSRYEGQTQYGPLKSDVANAVQEFLLTFQAKLKNVDESKLMEKLEKDEISMNKQADETLKRIQKAVGLRK